MTLTKDDELLSTLVLLAALAGSQPIYGSAVAGDGDSLSIGGERIRLFGIDAPELHQTCSRGGVKWACGSAAAKQLTKLITGNQVRCVSLGRDKHGRSVARCSAGDVDLNRTMVATGYALAYRRYSMEYVSAEESAKVAKRGIWSGTFELPSDVRHSEDDHQIQSHAVEQQRPGERPVVASLRSKPQPTGNCRIKGNRSRKGIGIYHLPGMPYYSQTVAEEIFCTEAAARAAGYRRSRADRHR